MVTKSYSEIIVIHFQGGHTTGPVLPEDMGMYYHENTDDE